MTASRTATVDSGDSSDRWRWFVLLLLATGVLIAFVDRTSISSAIADRRFVGDFALTNVGRGWVGSAFFWSYGLMQVPMGWVVDRYGVKRAYTICFLLWSAATVATGLVSTLPALVAMRLLVGAAEGVVIPASYRWIRNHFDELHGGTAIGIFAMGNKFGPALGAPIAAWLIVKYDWRVMFIVTGVAGLAWLIAWVALVDNDSSPKAAASADAPPIPFNTVIASPMVWGSMIVNFCYGYFTFYCMTWMPAYLVEQRGLSLASSGLYTSFSFVGIAVVAVVGGWIADRMIARWGQAVLIRKCFTMAGFIGGCTVLLSVTATSLPVALFWTVFSLSALGLATANHLTLCRITLIPKSAVGIVTGLQQVALSLSGGIAASLSGWLLHVSGGYDLPIYVIILFLVVGAASTWILLRPRWAPKVPDEPLQPACAAI